MRGNFVCASRTQKTNWGSVLLMCRGQQKTCRFSATWVAGEALSASSMLKAFRPASLHLLLPTAPHTRIHTVPPPALPCGQSGHPLLGFRDTGYTVLLKSAGRYKWRIYIHVSVIYDNTQVALGYSLYCNATHTYLPARPFPLASSFTDELVIKRLNFNAFYFLRSFYLAQDTH